MLDITDHQDCRPTRQIQIADLPENLQRVRYVISSGENRTGMEEGAMSLLCVGPLVSLIASLLCRRLPWPTGEVAHRHPTHRDWALSLHMQIPGFMVGFMCENVRCGINFSWGMVSVRVGERLNTADVRNLYAFIRG